MNESIHGSGADEFLELKHVLRALGDVVRLHIVSVLAGNTEMNVTDLAQMLIINGRYVSQPLVSWHLATLRRAGMVQVRRTGRQVYCSLDRERYALCLQMLGDLVQPAALHAAAPVISPAGQPDLSPARQ